MFVLVRNKITGEYNTIYKRDIRNFLNLKSFFNADPKLNGKQVDFNFEIIEDNNKIKEILENSFTSKGRGSEYNEDLPSSTKLAYSLFPLNIYSDKYLIRWKNNTSLVEQDNDKELTLSKGTFIHFVLEKFVCDREERNKDKTLIDKLKLLNKSKKPSKKIYKQIHDKIVNDIRKYIQMAYKDEEILHKITNIDDIKEELEYLATKCLPKFILNELIFTDLVYSEIFICENKYIQGSVDLVCYKDNHFEIWDYKTTSSVSKDTNKPKFKSNTPSALVGYARQLYIYNELLKKSGMTHLFDNSIPNFYIIQIHLLNGEYKKFNIPYNLIQSQGKIVEKVLQWYWDIRNGIFQDYIEEDEELEYISI